MQGKLETRVGIFVLAALCVFMYLGFRIGAFRLDRRNYHSYYFACTDIEGLSTRADVKIAGVKVGWVETIRLHNDSLQCVQTQIMIAKEYKLYQNAQALIRQEGLLGPKYIELIPGDSHSPPLLPDQIIGQSAQQSLSIDEMIKNMQRIMVHVEQVTENIKDLIVYANDQNHFKSIINSLDITTQKCADIATMITQPENKKYLEELLSFGSRMHVMADTFEKSVDIVTKQAQEGFQTINSVAQKIDNGDGCIGKLINDETTYQDFSYILGGMKQYFKKLESIEFVFDTHFENMFNKAENYCFADSKGYFDIRVYPSEDYFYLFQIVTTEKGFAYRKQIDRSFIHDEMHACEHCRFIDCKHLPTPNIELKSTFKRNEILFGFQFGKIFRDIALRFGIFEGTAGAALDIDIPFRTDNFRWVTSFEIFDVRGWNRKDDRRAHLKWMNRMYILRQIYAAFGADDFISKCNANYFLGVGIRFGDDDVKYLLSSI